MKMHILSGGRLRMRRAVYYPGAAVGETMDIPVSCALLKHAQGLVLFDTGCHPEAATNAEARWGPVARSIVPIFAANETLIAQLPLAGVAAEDIDVVVCSHLHFDHCGCNAFFPRATVLAQAAELAAAEADDGLAMGYPSIEWKLPAPIQTIEGERDLFGDGRIVLLPVPGHTPGMMAVHAVLDRDGAFVLASDAVAVRAHLDQRYVPKNTRIVDQALASIDAIARLRDGGATVLFGHDAEQWASLRTGAAFYA
jgi:glyoxylase-like metal-dependent hydrolase (beta-lactamase superfamily II)